MALIALIEDDKEFAVLALEAWLKEKGCTVWLDWDIVDDKERRTAAEFVYKMLTDIEAKVS